MCDYVYANMNIKYEILYVTEKRKGKKVTIRK
jgi:hypothetical protein